MANFADLLADKVVGHTIDLMRYDSTLRQQVLDHLFSLRDDIVSKINAVSPSDARTQGAAFNRLRALQKDVDASIKTGYGKVGRAAADGLLGVVQAESAFSVGSINSIMGVNVMTPMLNQRTMKSLASDVVVLGAPATEWWNRQADDLRKSFSDQMRIGVLANEANQDLVRRVRGAFTGTYAQTLNAAGGKVRQAMFTGGLFDTTTRGASALVRTSVQSVANDARMAMYRENSDVISGVQALVTLDARTSHLCKSRSGMAWDLDGNALEGTPYAFPGPPPWHFNCRSTLIPIVKSFAQLAGPRSKLSRSAIADLEKKIPAATQSSMDGQVAGNLTYETWLKTKPLDFQKEVLGAGRWELWNAGKVTMQDLVDQTGNPLTLAELLSKSGVGAVATGTAGLTELQIDDLLSHQSALRSLGGLESGGLDLSQFTIPDRVAVMKRYTDVGSMMHSPWYGTDLYKEYYKRKSELEKLGVPVEGRVATLLKEGFLQRAGGQGWSSVGTRPYDTNSAIAGLTGVQRKEFVNEYVAQFAKSTAGTDKAFGALFSAKELSKVGWSTADLEYFASRIEAAGARTGFSFTNQAASYEGSVVLNYQHSQLGFYTTNYEVFRGQLYGGWASAGGTDHAQIAKAIAAKLWPPSNGTFFGAEKYIDTYSDRAVENMKLLKKETEEFYKAKFAKGKVVEIDLSTKPLVLGRGVAAGNLEVYAPASIESWTTDKATVTRFSKMMQTARAPNRLALSTKATYDDILWSYEVAAQKMGWPAELELKGKKEFVLLGGRVKSVGGTR